MCRTTDFHDFYSVRENLLKIKAFFVRFSAPDSSIQAFPESLTLLYLPRINETALQVSGSKIRPDSSAFVTLHRVVKAGNREVIYGSREQVRAGNGVRFEVYANEEKVFKGNFRKSEGQNWKLECKCALEKGGGGDLAAAELSVADVCVAAEGRMVMAERVEMAVRRKNRRIGFDELEEIPEEREGESNQSDGACCCRCGESNGEDLEGPRECEGDCGEGELDKDLEGVRWAMDVGIWVMCLGVGFLVSKASAKSLRQLRLF